MSEGANDGWFISCCTCVISLWKTEHTKNGRHSLFHYNLIEGAMQMMPITFIELHFCSSITCLCVKCITGLQT